MVSKALVVAAYQQKAEEIARLGVDLTVLIPPFWQDSRGRQVANQPAVEQRAAGQHNGKGCCIKVVPVRFNGHFHIHHYPTLAHELAQIRPDILHMDEEPYNLATWLGLRAARRLSIVGTFFTWQNLYRRYPLPFRWLEQGNYRCAPIAIAGNQNAATVLRRKGYVGDVDVIPQFGVDPAIFCPRPQQSTPHLSAGLPDRLEIGYAGGLLPEKGVDLLLHACARLAGNWRLHLAGEGKAEGHLRELATALKIADRVIFCGRVDSLQMADWYRRLDVFVLPSRTTPTWMEQFGRVLIEAMASGVAVIGSDSGEIPVVIGATGLTFAEDSVGELQQQLQRLMTNPDRRCALAEAGRQRVLGRYTMQQVAQQTVRVYQRLIQLGVKG